MINSDKPLVAIHCLVYNHEPYLRDCFEGFVMQQTNFPFVAIVHDDASTDNSAAIIREYKEKYPNIIQPIYETENQWRKSDGSLSRIMNAAIDDTGAKYVAMCEGDDYWIDPLKLQKQVDFLEANPEYSMCFSNYSNANAYGEEIIWPNQEKNIKRSYSGDIFAELLKANYIQTCTILHRKQILDDENFDSRLDYELALQCALKGKCAFMSEKMSCYRIQPTSIIHTQFSKIKMVSDEIWYRYVNRYNSENEYQRKCIGHFRVLCVISYMLVSRFVTARSTKNNDEIKQIRLLLKQYPNVSICLPIGIGMRVYNKLRKLINKLINE